MPLCICTCIVLCVLVSVPVLWVWVRTAAREHSSNCVPRCKDIFSCENSLREHFPDQHYTLGLGSGCPWKNLGKVLWNSVFYAVPFIASCKTGYSALILSHIRTVTGGTKSMTSPVLRWTSPPRLQSVMVQTALRLGFSQTTIERCLVDTNITRRKYDKLLIMDWYIID